jgi:hypothetical protein
MAAKEARRMNIRKERSDPKRPEQDELLRALHFALLASRAPKASVWARCWIPSRRVRSPQ